MPGLIPGYDYDIFISYRQNDNKYDGWVTEFVANLNKELQATIKDKVTVYFDANPIDGLLETHSVDRSLEEKLKCLIFIPILSRTYCDPESYAWNNEFLTFLNIAQKDNIGLNIKISSGNVASRVLPIRIHDLNPEDITLVESIIGAIRSIDFIYKSPGVNRPLRANEDHPQDNLNKTYYRDQINKAANAIDEIIRGLKRVQDTSDKSKSSYENPGLKDQKEEKRKGLVQTSVYKQKSKQVTIIFLSLFLCAAGAAIIYRIINYGKYTQQHSNLDKSIAVLPFANLSNDPEQEYFSDGMVDEILDHLFKVGDLKVISRTSSMRYKNSKLTLKEIAHDLDVAAILEGSVRKIGNNVRITVQLIDAKTDTHLWSETYERDLSDIFTIQSEVAQNVARELKATMTFKNTTVIINASPTSNKLAYDFYLKGNAYWTKFDSPHALEMYSKAIQEDSIFTAAYAQRAKIHLFYYWNKLEGWQGHDLRAKEDIRKGNLLNPELPELRFAKAIAYYYLDREYDKALEIINELKTLEPNLAELYAYTAWILRRQGKWEESVIEVKHALYLDPFNANFIYGLYETYKLLHLYDNGIECSRQGLSLIPDYKDFRYFIFKACLDKTGDLNVALRESGINEEDVQRDVYYFTRQYDRLLEFYHKKFTLRTNELDYYPKTYELAFIYYLSDQKTFCKIYSDSTITYLKKWLVMNPDDERVYHTLGMCYAFNGNSNDAIAYGKKSVNLMPIKADAYQGAAKEQDLMKIYILTGNYDQALDKMEYLLSIPSWLSAGQLMIDPVYDKLRRLPRFQKIIDSAQKQSKTN